MRIWVHIFRAPKRVIVIGKKRQAIKLRRQLIRVKFALAQETVETKEMLDIYRRYTLKQASVEEMKHANKQFINVLKGLGIGVVAVLPFAPITLPIIIKAAKWVGVDVLPSSFNSSDKKSR